MNSYLADENVDNRIISYLRKEGLKIQTVAEIQPSISDESVLELALKLGAIILTEDKDFGELTYRLRKPNKGIILVRMPGHALEEKLLSVLHLLKNYPTELKDSFTVLSKRKIRIKKLIQ